ncbi:MAG: DUF3604 domain-containing protein [Nitrospinae bacterium]|nr:DUF3604 domain-containing protein [Nitrospinota bacterium]
MTAPRRGIGALREYFHGEDIGRAEIAPQNPIVAGRMGKWRVAYEVGPRGIDQGGGLRFTPPNGFTTPQFENVTAAGYCKFRCSNEKVALVPALIEPVLGYTFLPASLELKVQGSSLEEGDSIELDYGWTPSGIPGVQAQFLAMSVEVTLSIDSGGEGNWELISNPPTFDVLPEEPSFLWVTAPAQVIKGQDFSVRVVVRDCFHNVAITGTSTPKLQLPDESSATFQQESPGVFVCENIVLRARGVHRLKVLADGLPAAHTPPIQVFDEAPERTLLFGDPHCMSGLCVGEYPRPSTAREIVEYVHTYARDCAGVDFAACTSLAMRMDEAQWKEVADAANRFSEAGRYVALPAYEWFGMLEQDGNKNVYFLDDQDIPKLDSRNSDSDHPAKLWKQLEGLEGRVMTIPHHSVSAVIGTRWRWHDPRFQRLVEIYSCWGNSEANGCERPLVNPARYEGQSVQDALEKGYRLGIIAGSDTHTSQPGFSNRLRLKNAWRGGLACVWAQTFDREGIFKALWERRCYATTGARIILEFFLNDAPMGSEIKLDELAVRKLKVRAEACSPVRKLVFIKNAREIHVDEPGRESVSFEWIDSSGRERASDYYYVRLVQDDGEIAWSSPVWVDT